MGILNSDSKKEESEKKSSGKKQRNTAPKPFKKKVQEKINKPKKPLKKFAKFN
jgi:hypothetical protein